MDCVYLHPELPGKATPDGRPVHACSLHTHCTTTGDPHPYASCQTCKQKLPLDSPELKSKFQDNLFVTDYTGARTSSLRNILAGGVSFLVCGGPSANELPLELLNQRGIWSLAVNNVAGHPRLRPQAFVCSDPPAKFHDGIWLDPTIMKLIPIPKLKEKRGRLRRKVGDKFEPLTFDGVAMSANHCPNVWGFQRRSWMQPDHTFFTEEDAAWGNHASGTIRTGQPKTVCTMLLGLRLLHYLGSKRIYLVGVDFFMDPCKGVDENYSFGEGRDPGAVNSNNAQYATVNTLLCKMTEDKVFDRFGLEVYNCNPQSGLRAFGHVPFELAIEDALSDFPKQPWDLKDWYKK